MKLRKKPPINYVEDAENMEDTEGRNLREKTPTNYVDDDDDDDVDYMEETKRINLKKKARMNYVDITENTEDSKRKTPPKKYVDITNQPEKLNKRTRLPKHYVDDSEEEDMDASEPTNIRTRCTKKSVDISDDDSEDDDENKPLRDYVDLAENELEHRMSLRKQTKVLYREFLDDSYEKGNTNKNENIRLDTDSSLSDDDDILLSDLRKNEKEEDDEISLLELKHKQNELVFVGEFCGKKRGKYRDKLRYCTSMGDEILGEEMLSDMTINYSLLLLHQQFPSLRGLEDTELGPNNLFSVHQGKFVQILFADSHWLVVCSTDKTRAAELLVYDSSNQYGKLSFPFLKQMCQLRKPTKEKKLTITIQPVQQQQNGFDCGILALCYAVDLINEINPVNQHYHVPKLRQHLYACLTEEKFSPFPTTKKTLTGGNLCELSRISVDINCTCRRVTSQGMILCSGCHQLFHKICVDVPAKCFDDQTLANTWLCGTCDKERERVYDLT